MLADDTYYRTQVVDNNEFYDMLDFAVKLILKTKIKEVRFGMKYHYGIYNGKIKAYMAKRKHRNSRTLILKGEGFEIDCDQNVWDELTFREDGIDIDNIGVYIVFEKKVWNQYVKKKDEIEAKYGLDDNSQLN